MNVQQEYEGKRRIERPLNEDGWTACDQIESAKRGVPNESPRHERQDDDEPIGDRIWTVQAREHTSGGEWTVWTEWVDRATAEAEKQHAVEDGYLARIVSAS